MARKPLPRPSRKKAFIKKEIENVPEGPGVYEIIKAGEVGYVGSSSDLKERLQQHKNKGDVSGSEFRVRKTDSTRDAQVVERRLLKDLQPPQNKQGK